MKKCLLRKGKFETRTLGQRPSSCSPVLTKIKPVDKART